MATSYSNKGSSLAQRVSTQFEQQFGRPANAGGVIDPQFAAWSPGAMAKLQADDKAALERTQRNWNRVTKAAYAAEALLAAGVVAPALAGAGTAAGGGTAAGAGGGATGGLGMANTGAWTTSVGAAPGAAGGIGAANTGVWTSGVGAAPTGGKMGMSAGTSTVAAAGVNAAANLYGSKKGADAAGKSAELQTRAATEAARIQAQSSADQLAYIKRQSELDRLSKRFSDKQNYGLSSAGVMNDFSRYGDTSFNTRASELSQGRTQDKMYGARQNQMNYMRNLLGMPQNELSVYVEPDALQLTRPTLPAYVEDTTPIE